MNSESSRHNCDLGPLPCVDGNAVLEEKSVSALFALFTGAEGLILRQEQKDKGVDFSLEATASGCATNFRAYLQLKATSAVDQLADGTVSLSVSTANLNYLLNGPAPLYALYDCTNNRFLYTWARHQAIRLEKENPQWRNQGSITLHFTSVLSEATFDGLREQILAEGRLWRSVNDSMTRSAGANPITIQINPDSLKTMDANEAACALLSSGTAIVAAGRPKDVLGLLNLIEPSLRSTPRVQFIQGYALFALGEHYQALGKIRRSLVPAGHLNDRDIAFARTLLDAAEQRLGIIDRAQYQARISARLTSLTGVAALEARQELVYHEFLGCRDFNTRIAFLERLRASTAQLTNHPEAPEGVKLSARLLLLYADGVQADLSALRIRTAAEIRAQLFPGEMRDVMDRLRAASSAHAEWEEKSRVTLESAYDFRQPVLIAQALIVVLRVRVGGLANKYMETACDAQTTTPITVGNPAIERILAEAESIVRQIGAAESRLMIDSIRAEYLALCGHVDDAKAIARETFAEASAMGLSAIAEAAREVIDDRTHWLLFKAWCDDLRRQPRASDLAAADDNALKAYAAEVVGSIGSPPAHLKKVYGAARMERHIAQERYSWCRHLEILEDLSQTRIPATAYSTTPTRLIGCELHKVASPIPSCDAFSLLDEFKNTRCASCSNRDPLSTRVSSVDAP